MTDDTDLAAVDWTLIASHRACERSAWSPSLVQHALPLRESQSLTEEEMRLALLTGTLGPVRDRLLALDDFGAGVFIKIGGFSLKGSRAFDLLGGGRIADATDAGVACTALPARIAWALRASLEYGEAATLDILPWVALDPFAEFRAFLRDGTVLGVTQYNTFEAYDECAVLAPRLATAIPEWAARFSAELPPADLAVDLYAAPGGSLVLIELNPWVGGTDLGLFERGMLGTVPPTLLYRDEDGIASHPLAEPGANPQARTGSS